MSTVPLWYELQQPSTSTQSRLPNQQCKLGWSEGSCMTPQPSVAVFTIWEGVCAVRTKKRLSGGKRQRKGKRNRQAERSPEEDTVTLYKMSKDASEIYELKLPLDAGIQIRSCGYWTCAEIRGLIDDDKEEMEIVYHAEDPRRTAVMLQVLLTTVHPSSSFTSVVIRLDPDPYRLQDEEWISQRLKEWTDLAKSLCPKWTIVLDCDMPL